MDTKRDLYKNLDYFYLGSISIVATLSIALVAFLSSSPLLYYASFLFMIVGILSMMRYIFDEISLAYHSNRLAFVYLALFLILYFVQRAVPLDFSFIESDASYYYWSGIGSVLHGDTSGMFLPMADAISGMGFLIFGSRYLTSAEIILYLSGLLLIYRLLRELGFGVLFSSLLVVLFQMIPLDIWISKTTFSEPIWQVMLLLLLYYSIEIIKKGSFDYKILLPLYMILLLSPMTRGSSIFLYILIGYLALYALWGMRNFKLALAISFGLVLLSLSVHYSMHIRWNYVIGVQYRRIFTHITTTELSAILYSLTAIFFILLWYLKRFALRRRDFALWAVWLSVAFKIIVALYFAHKKGLLFSNLLYLNEYGMLSATLGMPLAILSIIGVVYIHYKALQADRVALLLVIFYHTFSVAFVMQNVTIYDWHGVYLYWYRYYFSEYLLFHFLALSLILKIISEKISAHIKSRLLSKVTVAGVVLVLFFSSINLDIYKIVTTEGYQMGSHKLFDWIKDKTKDSNVLILYDRNKQYTQRTLPRLMHAGLFAKRIDMNGFYGVSTDELGSFSKISQIPKISRALINSNKLLALSATDCSIKGKELILEDRLALPLVWRHSIADLVNSPQLSYTLQACIYKIQLHFVTDQRVRFGKHGDIANSLLGSGWHDRDQNHPYSDAHASLLLPNLFRQDSNYTLELELKVYGTSDKIGKDIYISMGGQIIYKKRLQENFPSTYKIDIPREVIKSLKGDSVTIDIDVPNALSPYGIRGVGDRESRGVDLYSIKVTTKL